MKTEEELIWESYIVCEMPYRFDASYTSVTYDNPIKNHKETKTTLRDGKKIGSFRGYAIYKIYLDFIKTTHLYLIRGDTTHGFYAYKTLPNGFIQTQGLYQLRETKGLLREFFIEYILKSYKKVISDDSLSMLAVDFWVKVIQQLKHNIEFGIYVDDQFNKLDDPDKIREYHSDNPRYNKYRYYIILK